MVRSCLTQVMVDDLAKFSSLPLRGDGTSHCTSTFHCKLDLELPKVIYSLPLTFVRSVSRTSTHF